MQTKTFFWKFLRLTLAFAMVFSATPAFATPGDTVTTPIQPNEVPLEIEVETGLGSLKQAPIWNELFQLLEDPYSPVVRRPGFGVTMPALNVWPVDYNFLTGQPLRLRTNDGEISWDLPGPMFDPDEVVLTNLFNVPLEIRTVIGALVGSDDDILDPGEVDGTTPCTTCEYLLVSNPGADPRIPPDGTVVAVPAFFDGVLHEYDPDTETFEEVLELEAPINENTFILDRDKAAVLGKALFWDMQIGSDGIQACASCHFHAGIDNRTQNQLNPNHLSGDLTLEVAGPNESVSVSDFPFHMLADPDEPGEPLLNSGNVVNDFNDVMSSMGVIFRTFVDIPTPGPGAFGPASPVGGVQALLPDIGTADPDPIPVFQDLRRVEPRNTPTFHGAVFNFDNFWDGRARFHFNGGSVFGPSDPFFHIFVDDGGGLAEANNGYFLPDLFVEDPDIAVQPVRIKFSSLASQAVGPPLSNFEMSFDGRNWAKIGKKILQSGVTPLANQLVDPTDSVLGPFSNQNITPGMPGLSISYPELIAMAFISDLFSNTTQHLDGSSVGFDPGAGDPFDGYTLAIAGGSADPTDTNQFTQMEANFSLIFGLAAQIYETLTIPDDTAFDQFLDANPLAANGIGQPGEQGVLFPTLIMDLVGGPLTLIPDDPATPHYDGFGPDELFGFDIFAGSNLTAALAPGDAVDPLTGINRNPDGFGSNPFTRTARCMQCHLGPEQTDHSINIAHGLLKGDAEFEFPTPPFLVDPFGDTVPAPEPPGIIKAVGGLILAEEVEEAAQDAVEVEPRNFEIVDNPATFWDERMIAAPSNFAFGDQGIYNIGLRPNADDPGRGDIDPFGWPLSLANLTLKNIAGQGFEPPEDPTDPAAVMANFDPAIDLAGGLFEETGDGSFFPGTTHTLQSINPGFDRTPITPMMPDYMAPWMHSLPAGELHPQIDEMAGLAPNTITEPNGGPAIEFAENLFGADLHCGIYAPDLFGGGPPNFGWGPECPNPQSGVPGNLDYPLHGTWPMSNRTLETGAFKAPSLRNVELTGPYFHTGSYLTLRQVVDFYMRGGDFPITNAESRDPHMVNVELQVFGFGRTTGNDLAQFADALPDPQFLYDAMPDTDHPFTPEPATSTVEQAEIALVRFMISLTDQRVKHARGPFDYPELFVPIDGAAPDNTGGREQLLADERFKHIEPVGAAGLDVALANFLDVSSVQGDPGVDHFDSVTSTAPTAVGDGYETPALVQLDVAAPGVLDNDSDPEGDTLTASLVSGPTDPNGSLTLNGDGSFSYTYGVNVGAPVVDSFTYMANDGLFDSNAATVTITVNPSVLSTITLVGPANESSLFSQPTSTWTTSGGTNNIYAVQLALDIAGPWFTMPIVTDSMWAMPVTIWNVIPSGSFVFWRVLGADLDAGPPVLVSSDVVWFFYRQ